MQSCLTSETKKFLMDVINQRMMELWDDAYHARRGGLLREQPMDEELAEEYDMEADKYFIALEEIKKIPECRVTKFPFFKHDETQV